MKHQLSTPTLEERRYSMPHVFFEPLPTGYSLVGYFLCCFHRKLLGLTRTSQKIQDTRNIWRKKTNQNSFCSGLTGVHISGTRVRQFLGSTSKKRRGHWMIDVYIYVWDGMLEPEPPQNIRRLRIMLSVYAHPFHEVQQQ